MKVAIIMGSKSDLEVVSKAAEALEQFGIEAEMRVMSAHRTPNEVMSFIAKAEENGFEAIIAAAGKAAHLPGVIAAFTVLPVIGLPIKSSFMDGFDSLLSIVQMPSGIPVATVAVNGGDNAGILAAQILSVKYPEVRERLKAFREKMRQDVVAADASIQGLRK
jgi:5-(carboxyamino)imidazole ribonucleotide mutase